jgi:hypothetical protein
MAQPNDMENASVSKATVDEDNVGDRAVEAAKDRAKGKAKSKAIGKAKEKFGKKSGGDKSSDSSSKSGKSAQGASESGGKPSGSASDKADSSDDADGKTPSPKDTSKNAKRAGMTASAVGKGMVAAKFFQLMQMLGVFMSGVAHAAAGMAGSFFGWLGSMISSAASAIGGFFSAAGAFVANAISVSATAATAFFAGGAIAAVGGLVLSGVLLAANGAASKDGQLIDCSQNVAAAQNAADVNVGADAVELKNAQQIYSIMNAYGLTDNEIAGVLGNWSVESGIDPTTIEGIYDEPQNINGPKHQNAIQNHDSYTQNLISSYKSRGLSINEGQYKAEDGSYWFGAGLAQITNGYRLIGPAEQMGKNWWEMDFQMAYYLANGSECTTGAAGGKNFWSEYAEKAKSMSPAECAAYFAQYFEGNTKMAQGQRQNAAADWASKMSDWSVDSAYANGVIVMAQQLGAIATDGATGKALSTCVRSMTYDNSTLASAAVSYAYETEDEGRGNNGTKLYQRVHDAIWPAGSPYQSCDYSVATAVRWSGTDEEYPGGDTGNQLAYLQSSDKWQEVGMAGSLTMKDLQPGDVFIFNGHTLLYVGNEAVVAKYPNQTTFNSVSGSYNERSPGCGADVTNYMANKGIDSYYNAEYHVFRCVKPDHGTTYANAGSGAN